jgi:spore photoproduct lyase
MKIDTIFVEKHILSQTRTQEVLQKFTHTYKISSERIIPIDDYFQSFSKSRRPYLDKQTSLRLFLAHKKSPYLKATPHAYGQDSLPRYYYIHAYNCVFECHYCFLQGHFKSPDLVCFLNHEDIFSEMDQLLEKHYPQKVWFHGGEFSDSLALSHLTNELPLYFQFFSSRPLASLELRTKSSQIQSLLQCKPLPNVVTSFSLSPRWQTQTYDEKASSLKARLKAMNTLQSKNFPLAIHLDPLVWHPQFEEHIQRFLEECLQSISLSSLEYISIGSLRFPKDVYQKVKTNYPQSSLFHHEFIFGKEEKYRYSRPLRLHMANYVRQQLLQYQVPHERIYLCMEDDPQPHF